MFPLLLLLSAAHAHDAHHSVLWYFSSGLMDAENVRPIVAYVDGQGRPVDWLFDSLILYDIRLYHTGGHPTAGDVEEYFSHLFEGGQLATLSAAVGRLKTELSDPDHRVQVYLSAPWLDGRDVDADIQSLVAGWASAGVDDNLQLVGFYYGNEEDACDSGEPARIAETAAAVQGRGYQLVWIPYHGACGYEDWKALGFDRATLQPNYAFRDVDESAFADTEDHIHDARMTGNEMEFGAVHNAEIPDSDSELYSALAYLSHADIQGWATNDWVTWYYTVPIGQYAESPGKRVIYDGLYRFVSANPRASVARRERLVASADAFVQDADGYRDTVDGSDRLNLGSNAYPNNLRTYVAFDLGEVDVSGRLLAAHLHLAQKDFPYGTDLPDAELWLTSPSWSEATLTWNNQPTSTSGAHLSDHRFHPEASYPHRHALDVTDAVRSVLDQGDPAVSFLLRRAVEDGSLAEVQLWSRESGDETAPALELVFEATTSDTGDPLPDDTDGGACPPTDDCPSPEGGCACGGAGATLAWGWLGLPLFFARRRRRGPPEHPAQDPHTARPALL